MSEEIVSANVEPLSVLGIYQGKFTAARLCGLYRGREWWIDSLGNDRKEELQRLVISAARFSSGNLYHSERGIAYSGLSMGQFLYQLFQQGAFKEQPIVGIVEDAPLHSPENIYGREEYSLSRMGLARRNWFSRWEKNCQSQSDFEEVLNNGGQVFLVNPKMRSVDEEWHPNMVVEVGTELIAPLLPDMLRQHVFHLIGSRVQYDDPGRYLPDAFWDILDFCDAVVVLHVDKSSDCLGIYTKGDIDFASELTAMAHEEDLIVIPFSIPPMLARWDRGIRECYKKWDTQSQGDFPAELAVFFNQESLDNPDEDSDEDKKDNTSVDDSMDEDSESNED